MVPSLIGFVLIAGAIIAAVRSPKDEAPEPAPAPVVPAAPVDEVPATVATPEVIPEPRPAPAKIPDSVLTDPLWVAAVASAEEARVFYESALDAKAKGDLASAANHGKSAREKYLFAIESTAEWEEQLLSKYERSDSRLVAIKTVRSDWLNKLNHLEKTLGR